LIDAETFKNQNKLFLIKGIHKRHPRSQEEGGLSSADNFPAKGFFRCGRPHFLF